MKQLAQNVEKPELAKEYMSADEEIFTQKLIALLKRQLEETYPTGITRRGAQPKNHGCVKAEFTVEPDLPADLQVGVFQAGRTYPALIRFANQSRNVQPDIKRDIRGMSIKLLEVDGEKLLEDEKFEKTQDFVMISHNVFPAKNVAEFFALQEAFDAGILRLMWFFFNPFDLHLRVAKNLLGALKKYANPLEIEYWSTTPYLFGSRAIKFSAKPCSNKAGNIPQNPSDNYLREAMKAQLAQGDACFDFMIQFQIGPEQMPIEDPGKAWNEARSPFQKVATIRIPTQTFDSESQMEFCENLSFTPWHSLPEHRPLGGVNRARKEVYRTLSQFRHDRNKVPRREPRGDK